MRVFDRQRKIERWALISFVCVSICFSRFLVSVSLFGCILRTMDQRCESTSTIIIDAVCVPTCVRECVRVI